MDYRYKQLERELADLSKVFSDLGARLTEVAKEVTAPGVNPSEKLIEQISASRASFENVRNAVHGHATAMLVSPLPKLGELVSVAAIDSLFKASAVAEESKFSIEEEQEKALAILGRVLSIIHRETADFKPLQECHAKIAELRNGVSKVVWPHRHPESESLVASKHPVTDLLHFVENLDQLDDERYMALETSITDSYGKLLFVAASRGKLAVPTPAAVKPAAAEKPVEKKPVAEKAPEKPAPAPVAQTAPAAAPAAAVEKKPAAPAPVAPAVAAIDRTPQKPVATPVATPEKKPASAPAAAASIPVAPQIPAAPAPAAVAPAAVAAASAPAPAAPTAVTTNSLSALATATEPVEKKPAAAPAPAADPDRQRKEPRLATPAPQPVSRQEIGPQEVPSELQQETVPQGLAGDGSQRPQRWGFWRGNR